MSSLLQFVPVTTPAQFEVVAALAREIWDEYYVPLIGRAQVDYMVSKFQSSGAMAGQVREGYEYFLTERYCLYTTTRSGEPRRLNIHHKPWPLQIADAQIAVNTMATAAGITLPAVRSRLHFAKRMDVLTWGMQSV